MRDGRHRSERYARQKADFGPGFHGLSPLPYSPKDNGLSYAAPQQIAFRRGAAHERIRPFVASKQQGRVFLGAESVQKMVNWTISFPCGAAGQCGEGPLRVDRHQEAFMTTDLQMLTYACILALVQSLVYLPGALRQVGIAPLVGNRESAIELTGWAGRAARAHRNMLESLVVFAALILVAEAAGRSGAETALGAQIFVLARLAYAAVYIAGVTWLRTVIWLVGLASLGLIAFQLL
jgi:uncharacterized MAPEG superfamily protein